MEPVKARRRPPLWHWLMALSLIGWGLPAVADIEADDEVVIGLLEDLGVLSGGSFAGGVHPGTSTDGGIASFDGTTGDLQDTSGPTLSDTGAIGAVAGIAVTSSAVQTDNLTSDTGTGVAMGDVLLAANGSQSAPGIAFAGDADDGIYWTSGQLVIVFDGTATQQYSFNSNSFNLNAGSSNPKTLKGHRWVVTDETATTAVAAADTGGWSTNSGAGGSVTLTLPDLDADDTEGGVPYSFAKTDNQAFILDCAASDAFVVNGVNQTAGENVTLGAVGTVVHVTAINGELWWLEVSRGSITTEAGTVFGVGDVIGTAVAINADTTSFSDAAGTGDGTIAPVASQQIALSGTTFSVVNLTSDRWLGEDESGALIHNDGASATVTVSLRQDAATGTVYHFVMSDDATGSDWLRIDPEPPSLISYSGSYNMDSGEYLELASQGAAITLAKVSATVWLAMPGSEFGTLTEETP